MEVAHVVIADFDAGFRQMAVKIGNSRPQRARCFFHGQGLRNRPEAKLVVLEARFEIEHQRVKQIVLGLVEATEVCSPAHISNNAEACRPQRAVD